MVGLRKIAEDLGKLTSEKERSDYLLSLDLLQWSNEYEFILTNVGNYLRGYGTFPLVSVGGLPNFMLIKRGKSMEVFALGSVEVPFRDQELIEAIELVEEGFFDDVDITEVCGVVKTIFETPSTEVGVQIDSVKNRFDVLTAFEVKDSLVLLEKLKPLSPTKKVLAFHVLKEYCPIHVSEFNDEFH